jgi:hypothetical protein
MQYTRYRTQDKSIQFTGQSIQDTVYIYSQVFWYLYIQMQTNISVKRMYLVVRGLSLCWL